ncbi:hypothetical protein ES319_A01G236300v1 [Gossypium barbadense]|uniref:Uncharacterized protein n=1 Tax=Gossypium barbadense TaxID=3634 RepID=A0A5J5X098_GOSBA|nr:hypothetical protein ES319_A01G236300v1 [Gossypium barbadense]
MITFHHSFAFNLYIQKNKAKNKTQMSSSKLVVVKDDDEAERTSSLEFQNDKKKKKKKMMMISSGELKANDDEDEDEDEDERNSLEFQDRKKKIISLGELKANDDGDDDGFKTPTSLDHKIPVMKQCPPAPRKPKPLSSKKRKPSSPPSSGGDRNLLKIDFAKEVESLFPSDVLADIHRKVKKARKEDYNQ